MNDEERYEAGLQVRREVLGNESVERSLSGLDDFSRPFQDLVSRYCWGDVWRREGLDRQQRSLINLAMIAALNRPHELKLHIRGALNNGLSREHIREVFLQVMVYCGAPASLDASRLARDVFQEIDAEATAAK